MPEVEMDPLNLSSDFICDLITSGKGWGDDILLRLILSFHDARTQLRSISLHWRRLIEVRFSPHVKYDQPSGGQCAIVVEEDLQLNKLVYTATLQFDMSATKATSSSSMPGNASEDTECGGYLPTEAAMLAKDSPNKASISKVAFTNWVPSYYRSNANDDRAMVHDMSEDDAIATWILVSKLLKHGLHGTDEKSSSSAAGGSNARLNGELCIACGGSGLNCRLCHGTGVREGTTDAVDRQGISKCTTSRAFLWVRCGDDLNPLCSRSNSLELARKRPLSTRELQMLQALLDHRRNPALQIQTRTQTPVVPFGGVSNV
jgi:hypothetical protein